MAAAETAPMAMEALWRALPPELADLVGGELARQANGVHARAVSRAWRLKANAARPPRGWHASQMRRYRPIRDADRGEWLGWVVVRRPGLTAEAARAGHNWALRAACGDGFLAVVRHLFEEAGLTAEDARVGEGSWALQFACGHGHLAVVQYLFEEVGLTAEDVRTHNNVALRAASREGHIAVVRYLFEGVHLTAEDGRMYNNVALRAASRKGHIAVVRYLEALQ